MRFGWVRAGILALSVAVALGLGGCGKKNAPKAPEGSDGTYPKTYPSS